MASRPNAVPPNSDKPSPDLQSQERIKKAAVYIIGAILLALVAYFGWTYLQNKEVGTDTVAAKKFSEIDLENKTLIGSGPIATNSEGVKKLNSDIDALVAEHGSTVYAWQALMIKANNAIESEELDVALAALEKAKSIELGDAGLSAITQHRYATVLLEKGDLDQALKQASIEVPGSFEASQQELLGDIYIAMKDEEKAIRSYQNAWSLTSKRPEERAVLRLKLQHLGVNPTPIEMPPQIVSQPQATTELANNTELETGNPDDNSVDDATIVSETAPETETLDQNTAVDD